MVNLVGKHCGQCGTSLPLSEYYRKGKSWYSDCKKCVSRERKSKYISQKKEEKYIYTQFTVLPSPQYDAVSKADVIFALERLLSEEWACE